jgi:hypothetical protein
MTDWKTAIDWPAEGYVDPHTGEQHPWDEEVPADDGEYDDGTTGVHTWQDVVGDRADLANMSVSEYLVSMRHDHSGYVDDGDDDPGAVGDYPTD